MLQELGINNCKELKSVFMELESIEDDKTESSTIYLLPHLKTMNMSWCPNAESVFPLGLAGGLPCLQEIGLRYSTNLGSFFWQKNNIMEAPALENLQVIRCHRFAIIIQKEANKSASLKELYLNPNSCNMESVPLGQISPGLEHLTIGNFKQLFQFQSGYSISNLECLNISDMIWLRDLWKGHIAFATNLIELAIESCNGLTYIFPMILIQNSPHLNRLRISYCETLEQIIAIDDILGSSLASKGLPFENKMEFPQLGEM
ncbi:uncharacterized protein LOC120139303 [Hibiscus syriacus]|uniref:uncharacterized protein LOC120139303 n=1 Tax=Hibiscus syriacus TaxID=106335 RepID=UPI0019203F13|nr:uncharacterized protein LOC120139303 [Hibiscus syriacus]